MSHTRPQPSAWPFPRSVQVGSTLYMGLQVHAQASDGIQAQTHGAFRAMEEQLAQAGSSMADLMKLHTYYLYEGEGRAVTEYWEHMTAARLDHLADPGPAATALRVQGLAPGRPMIGIDGIAELGGARQRIMPAHAWDWSIPTPFSQGWRVGERIYVGGQISADRQGRTIASGQPREQTANTLAYIRHVLLDAKAEWGHVATLKIAHRWTADEKASRQLADDILAEVRRVFPGEGPALTMLGVDLLYEGLLLEIDATAVTRPKTPVRPAGSADWHALSSAFAPGWLSGPELYLGAHSAPQAGGFGEQLRASLERLRATLDCAGARAGDLVKVNVFYSGDTPAAEIDAMIAALQDFLAPDRTVVSLVRLAGFAQPGQRVQIDGLAILGAA